MAWYLFGDKPLFKPMLTWCHLDPRGKNFSQMWLRIQWFSDKKMYLKMLPAKFQPFCLGLNMLRDMCWSLDKMLAASLMRLYQWHNSIAKTRELHPFVHTYTPLIFSGVAKFHKRILLYCYLNKYVHNHNCFVFISACAYDEPYYTTFELYTILHIKSHPWYLNPWCMRTE